MAVGDEWALLDAFLAGDDDAPPDDHYTEPTHVADRLEADKALRLLARLDREAAEVKEVCASERQRIDRFQEDRLAGITRRREWIESSLESFTRAQHAEGGPKSIKLPWGRVALRKPGQPRVVADDTVRDDGACAYLIDTGHPEFVRVTYALDANVVKERCQPGNVIESPDVDVPDGFGAYECVVTGTGELVEGIVFLVRGQDLFNATPGGD